MDQLTVYPPDDNGLEETTPEQRHSAGSVVVEQLEHVHTTLRRRLHPYFISLYAMSYPGFVVSLVYLGKMTACEYSRCCCNIGV